ncbi:YbhB/YbcL family Raf kinase inhibitor-like protein [Streptomyces sp. FXJ1.4098]|nr:YbhB/YbcL family Raf kinase inhibitor-like protein [Streptomyces sp. FXJ1.4098]
MPRSTTTTGSPPVHQGRGRLSPPLTWSGVPAGTAELALLCEDPDAPSGPFVHWLVTGIAPPAAAWAADGRPRRRAAHQRIPPAGLGRAAPARGWSAAPVFFRLYALPEPLVLPDEPSADEVHRAVDRSQLASGTLVGLYQR